MGVPLERLDHVAMAIYLCKYFASFDHLTQMKSSKVKQVDSCDYSHLHDRPDES